MLGDRTPDPGVFGPGSVTWRVVREPLILLSGGRALLMQIAHPLVAQGVVDHSRFETEPFSRLLATVRWVMETVFGTTSEARAACYRVTEAHIPVHGVLATANATEHIAGSTPYSAFDSDLALWVHATLVESMLLGYQALIGRLTRAECDRFVREWDSVASLLGVRPAHPWRTSSDLYAYVDAQMAAGLVHPVESSRLAGRTVLNPPFPWPGLRPASHLLAFMTAGFLPPPLRGGYQLSWTATDQRVFDDLCAVSRALHPHLPRRLRMSPLYDLARQRLISRIA
jgi:uncharacterized protein (DUF2236 family)